MSELKCSFCNGKRYVLSGIDLEELCEEQCERCHGTGIEPAQKAKKTMTDPKDEYEETGERVYLLAVHSENGAKIIAQALRSADRRGEARGWREAAEMVKFHDEGDCDLIADLSAKADAIERELK